MQIKKICYYREEEILPLYESVGWVNYVADPARLKKAFEGSFSTWGAYENEKLVGLIRAVGDGASILYIQDLLVLPAYQRQGIGTSLMKTLLTQVPPMYQIVLMTDRAPHLLAFYRSCGFCMAEEMGCCSFLRMEGMKNVCAENESM